MSQNSKIPQNSNEVILRFENLTFEYAHNKQILKEVDCTVRKGSKVTIMGQNGAGKSTIFQLLTGKLKPESGNVHLNKGMSIAIARQVIPRDEINLSVRDFFSKSFEDAAAAGLRKDEGKIYDLDPRIAEALDAVNLPLEAAASGYDRILSSFSGGQQARLLLASALIQNPDLLLLDEPTNNLDKAGIEHLTHFLKSYSKTVIVISHEADFLNAFTDGVLYLDVFTKKLEQYVGNYSDVQRRIAEQIEKENSKNARLAKEAQEKKDKANFFANKGGQMRLLAKRMRESAEEMEEDMVDTRKEDKSIRPFTIPCQQDLSGVLIEIKAFSTIIQKTKKPLVRKSSITLRRKQHLLLKGPNGIGKSTLLETIAKAQSQQSEAAKSIHITGGVKVGYYRQDFSTLNFEQTVFDALLTSMEKPYEEDMRKVAAGFLITGDVIKTKIGSLSEGQKGLVAFAQLVLQKPGLLILDEPTNHINFRHLPIIAEALDKFEGAMIIVSHVPSFVEQIRIDETLDLEK